MATFGEYLINRVPYSGTSSHTNRTQPYLELYLVEKLQRWTHTGLVFSCGACFSAGSKAMWRLHFAWADVSYNFDLHLRLSPW